MDTNDLAVTALWDGISSSQEDADHHKAVTAATVALAGTWPFLAVAKSQQEFETRLALMEDQIADRVPQEIIGEVVAGLKEKFTLLHSANLAEQAEARVAAFSVTAAKGEELPQAFVHVHKHGSGDEEYHQIDHVASPTWLNTIARVNDHDEAIDQARQFSTANRLPLYENGRYVEGKAAMPQVQPTDLIFDASSKQWVKAATLQRTAAQTWKAGDGQAQPLDAEAHARLNSNWGQHLARGEDGRPMPGNGNAAQGVLPTPHVRMWPKDDKGRHQVDWVQNGGSLQTLHRGYDADEAMNVAKQTADQYNVPVFTGDGKRVHGGLRTHAAYQPDPDAAARYYPGYQQAWQPAQGGSPSAPVPGPAVNNPVTNTSTGPDGFPIDYAQGENRSEIGYANQLTPGPWTVTPGSEWPSRPNAGSFDQTPVQASRRVAGDGNKSTDDFHTYNEGGYDRSNGDEGKWQECPSCHGSGGSESRCQTCDGHGTLPKKRSSRRHATEGAVPTPGPNPHYFEQGSQGMASPQGAGFPQNPSADIEPKPAGHIDEGYYDAPPPMMSGGSASDGTQDGQGYSRSATLTMTVGPREVTAVMQHGRDRFKVGSWTDTRSAVNALDGYAREYGRTHRVAVRKVQGPPPFAQSAEERTAGHRTAFSPDENDPRTHWQRGHYDASVGRPYAGEENQDHPHARAYREGWNSAHDSMSKAASTNGQIVGMCDHCDKPVRYHDDQGGHLRHLHNGSPKCADGRQATAVRMQWGPYEARFHVQGAIVENPSAENPTGRGADPYRAKVDFEGFEKQRPRQRSEDMNANTPTTAPEPIKGTGGGSNSPLPGADLDKDGPEERGDRDEDDNDD